jgi:hypothetical protein
VKRLKPDLKMPPLKVPTFLSDLYHDLRDRRLLPLVTLVLVTIVATPILLGQHSERTLPPLGAGPIAGLKKEGGRTSELTVVEAKPGLRKYQKRLRGRTPTDPFRQRFTASQANGGESSSNSSTDGGSGEGGSSTSPTSGEAAEGGSGSGSGQGGGASGGSGEGGSGGGGGKGGEGGSGAGGDQPPHATLYAFGVDLTIVHSSGSEAEGNKQTGEPETRKRVLPTTSLPGQKKQVVTYMGLSPKTRKPLFLVSADVTGVFGEGKCVTGTGTCQLIELEPGFPEVFEYGEGGDRYSIKVTNVEFVVTGHV